MPLGKSRKDGATGLELRRVSACSPMLAGPGRNLQNGRNGGRNGGRVVCGELWGEMASGGSSSAG